MHWCQAISNHYDDWVVIIMSHEPNYNLYTTSNKHDTREAGDPLNCLVWGVHYHTMITCNSQYNQISNTSHTKSQNLKMFLILSCSCLCPTHWSQVLCKKWCWSSGNMQCSNFICVTSKFVAQGVTYNRDLTVPMTRGEGYYSDIHSFLCWIENMIVEIIH